MKVILGPFHPDLEDALVNEVRWHKSQDRLRPLLVLVPSDAIRRRLKTLLVLDHRLDLIHLQILTFHQLSRRLYEEGYGSSDPDLHEDIFFEESLRCLIREDLTYGSPFSGLDEMAGGCAALWQTLRDLKDGQIVHDVVIQALKEGHFDRGQTEKLGPLFKLSLDFKAHCTAGSIQDYTDLDTMVMDQIPASPYLQQFHHIFHYGFYDLTQVQTEQFQSVARHHRTTLFFPLIKRHPGWDFSQRFYDQYVQPLVSNPSQVTDLTEMEPPSGSAYKSLFCNERSQGFRDTIPKPSGLPASCTIISCSGTRDETVTVAREILKLVTDEGFSFDDIGVVARSLSSYATDITDIFPRHKIPVSSKIREAVVRYPLTKSVLLLSSLRSQDYPRTEVIELLSSPYLNGKGVYPKGFDPRPDLWDGLTRRVGMTRGMEQWERLKQFIEREGRRQEGEDKNGSRAGDFDARLMLHEQAVGLWQTFKALHLELSALPGKAPWSVYTAHWKRLFKKYLNLERPEAQPEKEDEGYMLGREDALCESILRSLENLAALDAVVSPISLQYFIETFGRWLERASISVANQHCSGVSVMDVMAARGLSFKVLFLIGTNEGVFPRTIREDAFLRDSHRRTLETTLGYKVGEKLAGYDEEKLLFTLMVGSAGERLYCLYQRSDKDGKPLAPSWYLGELQKVLGYTKPALERVIPRGAFEKKGVSPFDRMDLQPPEELAVHLALTAQDPAPLFEQLPVSQTLYTHGHRALNLIENEEELGPFDGIAGPLPDHWKTLQQKGVSPTAMEEYALCPYKYFSTRLLGLSLVEHPEDAAALRPADTGELCHTILKEVYTRLISHGYFHQNPSGIESQKLVAALSKKIFSRYELDHPVRYAVVWEDLKERILDLIEALIKYDCLELSTSGYAPLALEVECESRLKSESPALDVIKGLPIRGRLDRIDYHPNLKRHRVIDYKLKTGKGQKPEDKNLLQAAVRGQRLQPPLYLLLAKQYVTERAQGDTGSPAEAAFYFLAPNWEKGPIVVSQFPEKGWEGEAGIMLKKTLTLLLEGIREGRFFIRPGNHCDYCDMSTICRRNHIQTSRRAAQDPLTQAHQALNQLKLPKTPSL